MGTWGLIVFQIFPSTEPTVVHFGLAVAELWQSASEAAFSGENLKENSPGVMMVYYGGNGL